MIARLRTWAGNHMIAVGLLLVVWDTKLLGSILDLLRAVIVDGLRESTWRAIYEDIGRSRAKGAA